jgi:hypothetical protein
VTRRRAPATGPVGHLGRWRAPPDRARTGAVGTTRSRSRAIGLLKPQTVEAAGAANEVMAEALALASRSGAVGGCLIGVRGDLAALGSTAESACLPPAS